MFTVDVTSGIWDETFTRINNLYGYTQGQLDFLSAIGVTLYSDESDARIEAARYGKPVYVRGARINMRKDDEYVTRNSVCREALRNMSDDHFVVGPDGYTYPARVELSIGNIGLVRLIK